MTYHFNSKSNSDILEQLLDKNHVGAWHYISQKWEIREIGA